MSNQPLHDCFAGMQRLARCEEVQRAAQAVDVRPGVRMTAVRGLLGRHVIDGADDRASLSHRGSGHPVRAVAGNGVESGDAQVQNFGVPDSVVFVRRQNHVVRFDVAMSDPFAMRILHRVSNLSDHTQRLPA